MLLARRSINELTLACPYLGISFMSAYPDAGLALPTPRFWAPVAAIGTAQFLVIMNNAMINIALPSLAADLAIAPANQSWIVTIYLLSFGSLLLLGGNIADALGHRRVLIAGLAVTALAALGASLADTASGYLFWRGLQGAAAAFVSPAAIALISTVFTEPAQRARAFGAYGAVTGAGGGVGLLLGGLLTDVLSWHWAMFASIPIAILAIIGALCALPKSRRATATPVRPLSVLLVIITVASLLFAITRVGVAEALTVCAALALALGSALALATVERRAITPLVPRGFFGSPQRTLGLITVGSGALGLTGVFVVLSQQMQELQGMSPMAAGLATVPYPLGMVLGAQFAPTLISRFGASRIAIAGLSIAAVTVVPLAFADSAAYLTVTLPALIVLSFAISPAFVAGTQLAMSEVDDARSGVAGALLNSASEIGGAIGVAAMSATGVVAALISDSSTPLYGTAMCTAAVLLAGGALAGVRVIRVAN